MTQEATAQPVNLLTTLEVAKQLNCSPRKVFEMVKVGQLKAIKLRRLVRYRQSDVDALLRQSERPANASSVSHKRVRVNA